MDYEWFKKMYLGEFGPSEREVRLQKKLDEYYQATPDSMPNVQAIKLYREFREWCRLMGYSSEEIVRAKKNSKFN